MPHNYDQSAAPLPDDKSKHLFSPLKTSPSSSSRSWRGHLKSKPSKARNESVGGSDLGSADIVQEDTPDSTEELTGLHILRHGVEPVNFDIVAVHGLIGHPYATWTHPNNHLWLRDSLPHNLPNTRVMTFGYDAAVFTKSVADVRATARALLSELNTRRKACQGIPMMFVCHSLGGIIFKEALNCAHTKLPDDIYQDVLDSTKAVAFLGTPHGGASAAWWASKASSLAGVLSAKLLPRSEKFVNCLQRDSEELHRISTDFVHRAEPLIIKSFCETKATGKANASFLVVDQISASMRTSNEEVIPVSDADHISICKIPSGNSPRFEKVAQKIIDVVEKLATDLAKDAPGPPLDATLRAKVLQCLYKKPEIAKQTMKKPVQETCTWILDYPKYDQWQDSHTSSILWISAPPGYGKTVLANFLGDRHTRRKEHRKITVCSFFCGRNMETQKSAITILRTVLWQLLDAQQELIHHAVTWFESQGENMADDLDTLWALWKICLEDPCLSETVIVIDALDECDKEHRDHLMEWIKAVFKHRIDQGLSPLRLIMTGRPDTFSSSQLGSLSIVLRPDKDDAATKAVGRDVDRVIDDGISKLAYVRDDFKDDANLWLTKHLKENAGKNFLWVSSALQRLESLPSLSRPSIQECLKSLPTGLRDLYRWNLSRIPEDHHTTSKFLLCLIAASKRPLSVLELNWTSAMLLNEGDVEQAEGYIQSGFEYTIRKLCGHMVDISNDKVCFIHRTLRDFLMPVAINASDDQPWYIFTELEANVHIIKCCIWRLQSLKEVTSNMPAAPIGPLSIIANEPQVKRLREFFGDLSHLNTFLEYTLTSLAKQYYEIETHASDDLVRTMKELYFDEAVFRLWCRGYWSDYHSSCISTFSQTFRKIATINHEQMREFVDLFGKTFEYSAGAYRMISRNGHTRILRQMVEQDPSLSKTLFPDGWTILNTIIDMEQLELVSYVLNQGADIDFVSWGSAPLHRAVRNGNLGLVQMLIDRHADANIQDDHGSSPLHVAARSGNMQIIRLLLATDAQRDILDKKQETPLHKAASGGHVETVVLLKDNGSSTGIRNMDGAVPLSKAIRGGRESVVQFLLKHISKEDLQDSESAFLQAAVEVANSNIIMLLLDADVDVNVKDKYGRTAISYMEKKFDRAIYEKLLGRGADVNARSADGATLLHKMATVDDIAAMQYLLDRGADIHSLTNESDTVLHYAVAHGGHEDVFQFLLDNGADIEARNKLGETPLLKAVACWRSQTTMGFLQKMKAQLEVRNTDGLTPLQVAIKKQNAGLTLDLLRRGADASVKTNDGQDLFRLAETSFLECFARYRQKGVQKHPYSWYAMTRDDNLLQKFAGPLEAAAITKIDYIHGWLQKFGVKDEFQSEQRPAELPHD